MKLLGIVNKSSTVLPLESVKPNITWNCFARIPRPIAASIPCKAEEGKNSPIAPNLNNPKNIRKAPEKIIAARVYKYPAYRSSPPNIAIDDKTTTTRPLPGPVIVNCDPPKIAHTIPPIIAAIIPEMGGAFEAKARPKPRGSATNETTKPEKIFLGSWSIKLFWLVFDIN